MVDSTITCRDCNGTFTFTAEEQKFYKKKGFDQPRHCSQCKAAKKQYHANISNSFMNNCVAGVPTIAVICSWCGNPCHSEEYCRYKEQATCKMCGKVGYSGRAGFESGLQMNIVHMACNCDQRTLTKK